MRSTYVDDISAGADDNDSAFQFSRRFWLREASTCVSLLQQTWSLSRRVELMEQDNQNLIYDGPNIAEEDNSYTKDVLGSKQQDGVSRRFWG